MLFYDIPCYALANKRVLGKCNVMLSNQLSLEELSAQIDDMRKLLIATGLKKGFSDVETLKYSEQLDKLIIQFQLQSRL